MRTVRAIAVWGQSGACANGAFQFFVRWRPERRGGAGGEEVVISISSLGCGEIVLLGIMHIVCDMDPGDPENMFVLLAFE